MVTFLCNDCLQLLSMSNSSYTRNYAFRQNNISQKNSWRRYPFIVSTIIRETRTPDDVTHQFKRRVPFYVPKENLKNDSILIVRYWKMGKLPFSKKYVGLLKIVLLSWTRMKKDLHIKVCKVSYCWSVLQ